MESENGNSRFEWRNYQLAEKISILEKKFDEKSSDWKSEHRQFAENARNILNEIETVLVTIKERNAEAESYVNNINAVTKTADESAIKLKTDDEAIAVIKQKVESSGSEIEAWHASAQSKFNEIEVIYNNNTQMLERLGVFEAQCGKATEQSVKIDGIHESIASRKNEIDKIYYNIFGQILKDEATGVETKVNGLKDDLDEAYHQLKINFSTFEESKTKELNGLLETWKDDFEKIKNKIKSLLPDALTAGLSAAYADKKKAEIVESVAHVTAFRYAILGMIAVSSIPFIVSVYSLIVEHLPFSDAIMRLPRLVLAILPLYIPATWIAYSENRKGNLSKRLIEEYSHKEALSKTYEGLSTQINSLGDDDNANDLRVKLLYNVLEVSSENPGKLISDYNKSDHPVMDALDKSVKLTNSVEKLVRIPGFTKLAKKLSDKAEKILERQNDQAEQGLDDSD